MNDFYREIKQISSQAKENNYSIELESIKSKITISALKGQTTCVILGNMSSEVKDHLKEQGFNIEYWQEYGQRFGYTIKW